MFHTITQHGSSGRLHISTLMYFFHSHILSILSQIDNNRVSVLCCHLYPQKPYVLFNDCLFMQFLSHPPFHSISFLSVSRFNMHQSSVSVLSAAIHLQSYGCCSLSVPKAHCKAHCFVSALHAINLFCLMFCVLSSVCSQTTASALRESGWF